MSGAENIKPLSKREGEKLKKLESVIDAHQRGFYEVGMALAKIQAGKLYRLQAKTIEIYAKEVWGMSETTLYQYINAALVFENLRNCGENNTVQNLTNWSGFEQEDLPSNESQCRPLTSFLPQQQPEVWLLVVQTSKKEGIPITAALVTRCIHDYRGEKFRQEIKKTQEELEKESSQENEPSRENGKNISEKMEKSFQTMLMTMQEEMDSNWRHTSKDKVRDWLRNMLAVVEDL